jgi:hypothetical protein
MIFKPDANPKTWSIEGPVMAAAFARFRGGRLYRWPMNYRTN